MSTTNATPERCPVCDAVLATEADYDASHTRGLPQTRIAELCWSVVFGSRCISPPVDWRARALAAEAERDAARDREVTLARGLLAILRTHEEGGEPETWTVDPVAWGDGRTTWEVHEYSVTSGGHRLRGLVCQFRPGDIDGTEQDANACVSAAKAGVRAAREVLARGGR